MLAWLEKAPNQAAALALLAEGVEMLEEDLDKERFFALTRRTYWDVRTPTRASTDNHGKRFDRRALDREKLDF